MSKIRILGAATHNLKHINLDLPRDQLIVITGLSGSGKSSLAFDTLYAEGQRRYVESLSTYARQFLSLMEKPEVEHIEGLSPAVAIQQKTTSHNPRSTVGTVTEIYDYLRLLFARIGEPYCPNHHYPLAAQSISQMVTQLQTSWKGDLKIMVLAPLVQERKGTHEQLLADIMAQGYVRVRIDGVLYDVAEVPKLNKNTKHTLDVVVDRLRLNLNNLTDDYQNDQGVQDQRIRLAESLETATKLSNGLALVVDMVDERRSLLFSERFACPKCGYSIEALEPRMFSFNSPLGACAQCDGLGRIRDFEPDSVVTHPEKSLAAGAIVGWDQSTSYYYPKLEGLAEHDGFDLTTPFNELSESVQQRVLYGTKKEKIIIRYFNDKGDVIERKQPFIGVIPTLRRRYQTTESNFVREELTKYMHEHDCEQCSGTRLNETARHVYIQEVTLPTLTQWSVVDLLEFIKSLELTGQKAEIAAKILIEIQQRLSFLVDVGLNYLSLGRAADTLSGGENQRIRLASQIGSGLVGVLYVLDEPSIGLHQRDHERLLQTLCYLRDLGNTVVVVEHDEDTIRCADFIVDMGPGAGVAGGEVVAAGTVAEIMQCPESVTGKYLSGTEQVEVPNQRTPMDAQRVLRLVGVAGNNLQNLAVTIPVGLLTCVTGVSGSGKSTLVNRTLFPLVARHLFNSSLPVDPVERIEGLTHFDKVVDINQSPIGRTPRSNPATYTGVFTFIRELFVATKEARSRGYQPGRFSFNVKGGRCEACQGDGMIKVEMHFLPDIYVTCDQCQGKRYNPETLDILYKGKNIYQVLQMTVAEAAEFFAPVPAIARKLQTLLAVGLSYISLGQAATTLSGGEAQRVKLAKELSKRATGRTLYILDEPTTGLHIHDVKQLLQVLHQLRDHGNTIVVIEHHLDVIKTADWIIDLGPEGGVDGGRVVATGTPEEICQQSDSYTGKFLAKIL